MATGQLVIKDSKKWGFVKGDILTCGGCGRFFNLRTGKVIDGNCHLGKFCEYVTDFTDDEIKKGFRLSVVR